MTPARPLSPRAQLTRARITLARGERVWLDRRMLSPSAVQKNTTGLYAVRQYKEAAFGSVVWHAK